LAALRLLPLPDMGTNDRVRQRIVRLVTRHGISHKVLAARMGMRPSTFSKWLNQKQHTPISVAAMDGFEAYVQALLADLQGEVTETAPITQEPEPPKQRKERRAAAREFHAHAIPDHPRRKGHRRR